MFDITVKHPNYESFEGSWQLMRDAIGGEDVIKDRDTGSYFEGRLIRGRAWDTIYLPMKSGIRAIADTTERAQAYYDYKLRAEFPEIVAPTITGQVGLICSQPPTVELPAQLEPLIEKATRDGLTLEDLFARVVVELLSVGRYGLMPTFDRSGRPYIAGYSAESMINWDTADAALSYVVLDECRKVRNPETNQWQDFKEYRELKVAEGRFESVLHTKGADGKYVAGTIEVGTTAETSPRPVDFMPFVILGTRDLSIEPDDVPLYGLARIAVRMYRMDADYQNSLHLTSEPTPWITGIDTPTQAESAPNRIGAQNVWLLPTGAQAGFLEFSGAGLGAQRAGLDAAKESASAFGARMFDETNRAPESGESRKQRYGYTSASLKTIARVAAAGIERAIRNQARWQGMTPEAASKAVVIKPNLDWVTDKMTPQEQDSLVKNWQAGAISYETLFEQMKAGKIVASERTIDDEIKAILDDPLREELAPEIDPNDPEAGGQAATSPVGDAD